MLTPFLKDDTIDSPALGRFIAGAYAEAGLQRSDVDSGAVILTGEAIKRKNARAIDELFAEEAGKFVCATAGHKLECLLAAHGSGAVQLSRDRNTCVLHVDIGGGTIKLALIDRGNVLAVAAFAVGGRCIASDASGHFTRVDDSAIAVAKELGLDTSPKSLADPSNRQLVAARLAGIAADYILGSKRDPLGASFLLTDDLPRDVQPSLMTFSGGVSEYLFEHETEDYGDIARPLATDLKADFLGPDKGSNAEFMTELMEAPYTLPGVSDGGAHTKFFTGGAWPTDLLKWLVRDEGKLTLEEAHFRLSALPAHAAGFRDRGVLREGAAADVVVYAMEELDMDPQWIGSVEHDLPGGEWRRIQRAKGYKAIIVNGQVTFDDGVCTGATPGRLLRHGRG